MVTCYVGIGSNLGDRQKHINSAIEGLKNARDIRVTRVSSIYETEPVGDVPQGKFLNGVIEVETALPPRGLLKELSGIEARLGRERAINSGQRTIDLDILYYGDLKIDEEGLRIPHPRINEREFVLKGLRELGKAR